MEAALGQLFGSGIGVALSPIPVIAIILMLSTPKGRTNGTAFGAGWIVGLTVATGIVLLLADGADQAGSDAADGVHIATLVFGALFLVLAVRQWQARPPAGSEPELPKWMAGIDGFTSAKAFALGLLLSGVNPKNLVLAAGAAIALAQTSAGTAGTVAGIAVFVVIGSFTVVGPIMANRFAGSGTAPLLAGAKVWMVRNNATIMFVLFLVLGVTKVGDGLGRVLQ